MVTREALDGPEDEKIRRQLLQRFHLLLGSVVVEGRRIYASEGTSAKATIAQFN